MSSPWPARATPNTTCIFWFWVVRVGFKCSKALDPKSINPAQRIPQTPPPSSKFNSSRSPESGSKQFKRMNPALVSGQLSSQRGNCEPFFAFSQPNPEALRYYLHNIANYPDQTIRNKSALLSDARPYTHY